LPLAVNVSNTLPDDISEPLGVYVAAVKELALANVPVPLVDHVTPLVLFADEPVVILTAPSIEQVGIAEPALAVGAAVIVNVFVDVAAVHEPALFAVSFIVTLPALISAALGLYVAAVNDVALVNVPVPVDDHAIDDWFVAEEPPVIFTAPELEHVARSAPAAAVGGLVKVNVFVEVAGEHVPVPLAVNVNETLPADISAALGV
jgi:hypothetical protein